VRSANDDDVVVTDTDLVKDQYDHTILEPSSSFAALHTRAWRGLQALGFKDVPIAIQKHGVARVVLGLNWVESNPYSKNKGGLLRSLLDSGDPIPPPLPGKQGGLPGKYRKLIRRGYCAFGGNCGECADCLAEGTDG